MHSLIQRLKHRHDHLHHLFTRGIWQSDALADRSAKGRLFAVLRIVSMTWSGVVENSLASRAGALSYSSMLGLAPLVALVVIFSSMVLETSDPNFAIRHLNNALEFIAPQLKQLHLVSTTPTDPDAPATAADVALQVGEVEVNPVVVEMLNNIVAGSSSKTIGLMGALALIIIVVQLFSSIENAFNDIWGVRRGRNWFLRIIIYWAAVTLGAVLVFASLATLSASTFVNMIERLPLGAEAFVVLGPIISMGVLAALFTSFYKFIPNTSVGWWPAVTGAAIVVGCLYANNLLAFLYLRQTMLNLSLYKSLVAPIILMLGLYVFWLVLLVGGQITYAVQNVNYRSSRRAWIDLNHSAREGLALLVLTIIARRFRECLPPYSVPQISELVRIPAQILNACLSRLGELDLVSRIPPDDRATTLDYQYQPARPLDRISMREFKVAFEGFGDGPDEQLLDLLDPVLKEFHGRVHKAVNDALEDETLESLIVRLPAGPSNLPKSTP